MDILMPEMGGYEATTKIRKVEELAKLSDEEKHFICGFSADVGQGKMQQSNRLETQKKALDSGMNRLVEKPMKGDNLKLLIESNRRESNQIKRKDASQNILPASHIAFSGLGA